MNNETIKDNHSITKEKSPSTKLSLRYFFKFLLISVFPSHFWASIMILRDLEFVAERTNTWDSIGYAGYSLMFALAESVMIALVLWLFSLVFPKKWTETRTISVIGSIYLVLAGASILDMAANAYNRVRIARQYLYGLENFTLITYVLIAGAILIAITASLLLILKTRRGEKVFADVFERIMLLSGFYLVLDAAGIIIVIIRNVF